MQSAIERALKKVDRYSTYLKTSDLEVGHVYKFRKMWLIEHGQFGEQLNFQFKYGKYSMPKSSADEIIKIFKHNPAEFRKLIGAGIVEKKSLRIKLVCFKGKQKNSPRFQLMTTPQEPGDRYEESSEEEDEDEMMDSSSIDKQQQHSMNGVIEAGEIDDDEDGDDDVYSVPIVNSAPDYSQSQWITLDYNNEI